MASKAAKAASEIFLSMSEKTRLDSIMTLTGHRSRAERIIQQAIDAATFELRELLLFWGPSKDDVEAWMEEEGSDYDPQMMQGMLDFIERNGN